MKPVSHQAFHQEPFQSSHIAAGCCELASCPVLQPDMCPSDIVPPRGHGMRRTAALLEFRKQGLEEACEGCLIVTLAALAIRFTRSSRPGAGQGSLASAALRYQVENGHQNHDSGLLEVLAE